LAHQVSQRQRHLYQRQYRYDASGNLAAIEDSRKGIRSFHYDPLDRLTEERGVQGGRSYAYDAVGNRTQRSDNPASGGTSSSQDYQYAPDSNRLTAIGAQ
ncbi:RHS repeat protein, partial [Pseudomonas aeruginosa]|nr:RHS repeat protein [Pseudomonas aeruginosa]